MENRVLSCDVCIVGAGAAGIFAGLALCKSGYNVYLIEKKSEIGGTFSQSWIHNWIAEPNTPIMSFFYDRLHNPPYKVYGDYNNSWLHWQFNKRQLESGLSFGYDGKDLIDEFKQYMAQIHILVDNECFEVSKTDKTIKSIKCRNRITQEIVDINALFFIDASGDAVLSRLADIKCFLGSDSRSLYNESLAPLKGNPSEINQPSLLYALTDNPAEAEDISKVVIDNTVNTDGYIDRDGVTGKLLVNPLTGLGLTGLAAIENYEKTYQYAIEQRKKHWKYVKDFLEKKSKEGKSDEEQVAGWKVGDRKYFLSKNFAPALGIRESYRVHCVRMLNQNDLTIQISSEDFKNKHFIACGNHEIDIHGFGSKEIIEFNKHKLRPYGVPLECFIPCGVSNMFVAGRCAGYSHIADGSFRINKSCAQSGWAVGNAVKLLLDNNLTSIKMDEDGHFDQSLFESLISERYTDFSNIVNYLEENVMEQIDNYKKNSLKLKKIPVLFIIFNRLDLMKISFDAIRSYAPEQLFVAADGGRTEEEKAVCQQVRDYVVSHIDWPCQVELLFQSENLGCGLGPATAITWFFQHVPFGIILEDDNVPSLDAFHFCEKLLPKYENDEKIMMINLTKPLKYDFSTLYTFTKYPEIWGWATWARAWRNFSFDLNLKDEIKAVKPIKYFGVFEGLIRTILWKRNWKKDVKLKGKVTFWDYQWSISIFKNRGICVAPSSNMISNIGFGTGSHCPDAEHPMSSLPYETINLELKEPDVITLNTIYDKKFSKYWGKTFFYNLRKSLRRRVLK